jgi:hypothetical protein
VIQYTIQVITHKEIPSWISILNYNRFSNKFPADKPKILNIDFTNTHDIKPYHIVSLACLIEEYYQEGIQIKFAQMDRDNDAVTYLRKLGFFQYWTSGYDRKKFKYVMITLLFVYGSLMMKCYIRMFQMHNHTSKDISLLGKIYCPLTGL